MIYLDTNIIIYAIENHSKYGAASSRILSDIERGKLLAGASSLVLLEVVGALRKLNVVLRQQRKPILDITENIDAIISLPITWFDVTAIIIQRATQRLTDLHPADAVHVVTAEIEGMREIYSADADFDDLPGLRRVDPLTA
jgi:predicted nucleic acid-binding protein